MNNNLAIQLFIFFQIINFIGICIEWDNISDGCTKKQLAGRLFIILLPSLVILSLIIRPLE